MNLVVTEDTFAHFGFDSKKTESKIFLIDAKLRLTSKASKIGLGCNAWWEGFSKSSWPVEVVTVVLKSDVFFDPLRLIFFGKNCEKLHRPLLLFLSLNSFSWTAGNRKGAVFTRHFVEYGYIDVYVSWSVPAAGGYCYGYEKNLWYRILPINENGSFC